MLWIRVRVGESVSVGDSILTLVDKSQEGVLVDLDGEKYSVDRDGFYEFPTFTLHAGNKPAGLQLGFEAPQEVRIRRI